MKKLILFCSFLCFSIMISAQCDELFISEYVEGYANNKALEIYNPTSAAIDLSGYSLARFSNGSTTAGQGKVVQLPADMLEPNDTYVIVVNLTDVADWNTQFDKPAWNGFNVIDTIYDAVTGLPVTDDDGNVLVGPTYNDEGAAIFGDEYNEEYDLQCKADAFLNPVYNDNNVMYFNGNDAVALMSGTEVASDGSNIIDVIGVIGEDPTTSIMEDAWVDADGFWLTKDRTLVRRPEIMTGRNELTQIVASAGGTFTGEEWISHRKNSFQFLGIHNSDCNTEAQFDMFSCSLGPLASNTDINIIDFKVFPNPSLTGFISIHADEQIRSVALYDVVGQLVHQTNNIDNKEINQLYVGDHLKGMFTVKVNFNDGQFSIRQTILQ